MTKKGFLTAEEYKTIRQTLGFSQAEAERRQFCVRTGL